MLAVQAMICLGICGDSTEPSLLADVFCTDISCTGLLIPARKVMGAIGMPFVSQSVHPSVTLSCPLHIS